MAMIKNARQLSTVHVSVCVPWHDARWAGNVCTNPCGNTSSLISPQIAASKDDAFEASGRRTSNGRAVLGKRKA